VFKGVYGVGHVSNAPPDRAFAALLACGPKAVISHGNAAFLWGVQKTWQVPIEVTAPSNHRRRGILVHRSRTLTSLDRGRALGIRVTSLARTVLDITPRLDDRALKRAITDGTQRGYLRLEALADAAARHPNHPGATRLKEFVPSDGARTRSGLENSFLEFVSAFGLPVPTINTHAAGYEVDALFEAEGVIVEVDAYGTHCTRASFESDRERDVTALDDGIVTVRLTEHRMKTAAAKEAARLNRILERRRREREGPTA